MSRPFRQPRRARDRHAWLELLQRSGPFLTLPVVERVFPDGLPEVAPAPRSAVRAAVADLLERGSAGQRVVIETVLCHALDWREHLLLAHDLPDVLAHSVAGYGLLLRPDLAFHAGTDAADAEAAGVAVADVEWAGADEADHAEPPEQPWRMLGVVTPYGVHPLARSTEGGWTASPVERLATLLRARDIPVGLVTDGRWWAIVWAPVGGTTGAGVWDASLWSEEPETFQAFVALLTRARFLGVAPGDTLPAMLTESLGRQEEVTTTLGRQVRDAVELLLSTLDAWDADSGGALLEGVSDDQLYDGVVTVMMRIVFLLFAEERALLPADDAVYEAGYGIGRLIDQLEQTQTLAGEQALEHRTGAWHRLLAVTRALHAGVAHEDLRLPAYGGGLFDPDRYPWLEGRLAGQSAALPPAVDDRTVLRMLKAVQEVNLGGERRRLSFRTLDVEQIGYVYEGLLELEVRTADEVVLCLARPTTWPRTKTAAEVPLTQASEHLATPAGSALAEWVAERTGWSRTRVAKTLDTPSDRHGRAALLRACAGDTSLADSLQPLAGVLHVDPRGLPAVTLPGRRYIAPGTRRISTGTHYTPRSLAEDIVINTLEPLVYRPGPLETADRSTWRIRPSNDVLALRVADIAMGSGAFLVAACRYLAGRLLEGWEAEGRGDVMRARAAQEQTAADAEVERVTLDARRLVAEHCLYGVDVNPLAVEMGKLSLWLVTMDRERPFGFLDDRLVAGDSLLGLASLEQLQTMHANPDGGPASLDTALFAGQLNQAADLRRRITAQPVVSARDVEFKARLLTEAKQATAQVTAVADAVTAIGLRTAAMRPRSADAEFANLALAWSAAGPAHAEGLAKQAARDMQAGRPAGTVPRTPLQWPVVFPEVFADADDKGFDAIVGNPPFLGGKKISGTLGDDYLAWLARWDGRGIKGNTDLAARFVLRAERLLAKRGQLGYIATNTLVQGDTLEVGLAQVAQRGLVVRRGRSSHPWPSSSANLEIVDVWASRAPLTASTLRWLDGEEVPSIGADLEPVGRVSGRPVRLPENDNVAFIGSYVLGLGFTLTLEQAQALIDRDPRNADVLQPYVIGQDLNQRPDCSASRWIINFRDWSFDHAAEYPSVMEIVERLVKPQRDLLPDYKKRVRENWWRYEHQGPALYRATANLDQVLAISLVGSALMPVRVPAGPVFAHKCGVFALDDFANLAVLSSSVHTNWTIRYTSTMRTDINYSPSDAFLTLPRPNTTPELERLGGRLDGERRALMLGRGWGLTTTYNHVHNPRDCDPAVVALRDLHVEIDQAVLAAYGWDLDLDIGHYPTKIGIRWTVSPRARFELLDLLLEENHRRARPPTGPVR